MLVNLLLISGNSPSATNTPAATATSANTTAVSIVASIGLKRVLEQVIAPIVIEIFYFSHHYNSP
jgi:hypothetical protein